MFDPFEIRKQFPQILELEKKGYIYLDNNATTPKPVRVIDKIQEFYKTSYATVNRGIYSLITRSTNEFEDALDNIGRFIGADFSETIPSFNSTDAMNMLALSLAPKISEGDIIVLSLAEHHSTIMPWRYISRIKGAKIEFMDLNPDGSMNHESLEKLLEKYESKIKVVVGVHVSNVNGVINNLREICRIAHSIDAICIGDLAQSVSHMPVNVKELEIDAGVFSGHKMFGPAGTGILYLSRSLSDDLEPGKSGSGMILKIDQNLNVEYLEPPWKFIPGTPNIEGVIGLSEAASFLRDIGMDNVLSYLRELQSEALKMLYEIDKEEKIIILSPPIEKSTGVVTFNIKGIKSEHVAFMLDMKGIAVRSGHHCAYLMHRRFGINDSVRASPHIYNTRKEIEKLIESISEILKNGS